MDKLVGKTLIMMDSRGHVQGMRSLETPGRKNLNPDHITAMFIDAMGLLQHLSWWHWALFGDTLIDDDRTIYHMGFDDRGVSVCAGRWVP